MKRPNPQLILVCRGPDSGKTRLAKQLADEIPAVRLCPDEWMAQLGIKNFSEDIRALLWELYWELAQELLRQGQNVILELGFWARSEWDEKRVVARTLGVAVGLHDLDAPFEKLCGRLEDRNQEGAWGAVPIRRKDMERWAPVFHPPGFR